MMGFAYIECVYVCTDKFIDILDHVNVISKNANTIMLRSDKDATNNLQRLGSGYLMSVKLSLLLVSRSGCHRTLPFVAVLILISFFASCHLSAWLLAFFLCLLVRLSP